jgi:RNA polymerase sigma-70 factor, ECF subfamily
MGPAQLAETIARARGGDLQAWGDLYANFAPAIFRFCRRVLPTREDAEDATTEIFMKIRPKLDQYDRSRSFSSWLYKVAANHCWDKLRRRHIRQDLETGEVETLPIESPDPDQLARMIAAHTSGQVRDALATLTPRARMALVLRYYAEMDYEEIADNLGLPRAGVGVVLLRARRQLREALQGMQHAGAAAGTGGQP